MFLLRYWKQIAVVVIVLALAGGLYGFGYYTKAVACEAAMLTLENAQLKAAEEQRAEWRKEADAKDEALRKALSRKPAAPTINEAVNANPSGCVLPAAVGNGLRDAIARANEAGAAD